MSWCFTSKAVSMTWRILDESSCSRPTSAMGKYFWSFYIQKHTKYKKINPWPKLWPKKSILCSRSITSVKMNSQPCSTWRSGWWQQRWEWCCVCPTDGPVLVLKGNPGLYPLCICPERQDGSARRCAAGCLIARWCRQPRSGRLTQWRRPGDVCCGRASQSYPKTRIPIKWEQMQNNIILMEVCLCPPNTCKSKIHSPFAIFQVFLKYFGSKQCYKSNKVQDGKPKQIVEWC